MKLNDDALVDRVAKAMWEVEQLSDPGLPPYNHLEDYLKEEFRALAKAAIKEIIQ